jgi:hypothetical protein
MSADSARRRTPADDAADHAADDKAELVQLGVDFLKKAGASWTAADISRDQPRWVRTSDVLPPGSAGQSSVYHVWCMPVQLHRSTMLECRALSQVKMVSCHCFCSSRCPLHGRLEDSKAVPWQMDRLAYVQQPPRWQHSLRPGRRIDSRCVVGLQPARVDERADQ